MKLQLIQKKIFEIREQKVMLDFDLAELYEVETRALNQAVKRNVERFPERFMFQLTKEEWKSLISQFVISKTEKRGGTQKHPFVFTEHGVAMLAATNALFAGLNLARSEAIKRNARAVLCKTANGVSCTASGGWEQGWILFHDLNNNAALDAGEEVLRQQGPASAGIRLAGNLPIANYVSYTPTGTAKLISGAFQAGTFTLCVESSASADVRQIVLSGTGRARAQKGTASDCS